MWGLIDSTYAAMQVVRQEKGCFEKAHRAHMSALSLLVSLV